jgi:hypothetical protein
MMHPHGVFHPIRIALALAAAFLFLHCGGGSSSSPAKTMPNDIGIATTQPTVCEQITSPGEGRTFYLDPVNGSNDNSGSADSPWGPLQSVIENGMIETRACARMPMQPSTAAVPCWPPPPIWRGSPVRKAVASISAAMNSEATLPS